MQPAFVSEIHLLHPRLDTRARERPRPKNGADVLGPCGAFFSRVFVAPVSLVRGQRALGHWWWSIWTRRFPSLLYKDETIPIWFSCFNFSQLCIEPVRHFSDAPSK